MAKWCRAGLTRGEIASYPLVPNCRYRLKEFVVSWFRRDASGSHEGEWLVLPIAIALSFEADESEKEYWRIHG